jgi:hypothetical protein
VAIVFVLSLDELQICKLGGSVKIKAAKDKIKNSAVGIIIILAAYIIVNSVLGVISQIL